MSRGGRYHPLMRRLRPSISHIASIYTRADNQPGKRRKAHNWASYIFVISSSYFFHGLGTHLTYIRAEACQPSDEVRVGMAILPPGSSEKIRRKSDVV